MFHLLVLLFLSSSSVLCSASGEYADLLPEAFENPNLCQAYSTLQSWKSSITSDPSNVTATWIGPDVCSYSGVFCAPSSSDPSLRVVSGVDLNHADIAGTLPDNLGRLSDLALLHLNSNRFCGSVPKSLVLMTSLLELDLSNNHLVGAFPEVILELPSLKYLDLRFNDLEGPVPDGVFDMDLAAIILNNNRFRSAIPQNFGNSPASVIVLANNDLGCVPNSIGKMASTLEEIVLSNGNLNGCLPPEIGMLKNVRVFDLSSNRLEGPFPEGFGKMRSLEVLNIAQNGFSGVVPTEVCGLPRLMKLNYSFNYITAEGEAECCEGVDDGYNCIPQRQGQRKETGCWARPVDCNNFKCGTESGISPSTSSPPPQQYALPPSISRIPPPPPPLNIPIPIPRAAMIFKLGKNLATEFLKATFQPCNKQGSLFTECDDK